MPRGAKPIRGLEEWKGGFETSHKTEKRTWGEGSQFIGVDRKVQSDGPCALAKTGDSLTVWAVPYEVVGGVSVQGARIFYGMF